MKSLNLSGIIEIFIVITILSKEMLYKNNPLFVYFDYIVFYVNNIELSANKRCH